MADKRKEDKKEERQGKNEERQGEKENSSSEIPGMELDHKYSSKKPVIENTNEMQKAL